MVVRRPFFSHRLSLGRGQRGELPHGIGNGSGVTGSAGQAGLGREDDLGRVPFHGRQNRSAACHVSENLVRDGDAEQRIPRRWTRNTSAKG